MICCHQFGKRSGIGATTIAAPTAASACIALGVESVLVGAGLGCLTDAQCTSPGVAVVRKLDDGVHSSAVFVALRHLTKPSPDSHVAVRVVYLGAIEVPPLFCVRRQGCLLTMLAESNLCAPLLHSQLKGFHSTDNNNRSVTALGSKYPNDPHSFLYVNYTGLRLWAHTVTPVV